MRIKNLIGICMFLIVINLTQASLEGYTTAGTITDGSNPLYNAEVVLHSTAMGCECYNEIPDYTSSTGQYSSSADNLVFKEDCSFFSKGDACAPFIDPETDQVWIDVKGYSILPKPYGNAISPKQIWGSYELSGSVYFGLDISLPALKKKDKNIIEEEREEDSRFWITPAIAMLLNPEIIEPEIDNITVKFTESELKDILGEDLAKQVIERYKPQKIQLDNSWFGWYVGFLFLLVLIVLFFIGFKQRKNE